MKMLKIAISFLALSVGSISSAEVCDYRPSELVGVGTTASVGTAAAGVATVGAVAKVAGFYTLTHAVTGATMLGSTAGGISAAGTVGIMGGTAGVIGTMAAVITAPVTIIAAVVVGTGIAIYEGSCYFADERITDYDQVLGIIRGVAASAEPEYFKLHPEAKDENAPRIEIYNGEQWDTYELENLYIVNGLLMHRDWGKNTTIGRVGIGFDTVGEGI